MHIFVTKTKNFSSYPVNWISIYLCRGFSRDTLFHRFKSFIRFVFAAVAGSEALITKALNASREIVAIISHSKIVRALIRIAIRLYADHCVITGEHTDRVCLLLLFFHHSPSICFVPLLLPPRYFVPLRCRLTFTWESHLSFLRE